MRVSTTLLAAGVAVMLLSACSSTPQGSTAGLLPTGASGSDVPLTNPFLPNTGKADAILRQLYVTEPNDLHVALLKYGTWKMLGTITNGIGYVYGDWVDKNGNLYAANAPLTNPGDVTEYDSTGNLIFTYSTGMREPVDVTTDNAGNVYEADQTGTVTEYAQGSNVVAATCSLPSGDEAIGVVVNKHGTVFVTFRNSSGGVIAYPNGLKAYTCAGVLLPVKLSGPAGIAVDRQGNLVVCDSAAKIVDIIPPPFSSVSGTLGSGWANPFFVTIDRAGTQAYVADPGARDVQVLTYPGGATVATLGSANGLNNPVSAVDSKNYVP